MTCEPEILLGAPDGTVVVVDEGESADIVAQLYDISADQQLDKSMVNTLTVTQTVAFTDTIINARDDQSIFDENGGTVEMDGLVTLKLTPLDTAILVASPGQCEEHWITFAWSWIDPQGVTRTGKQRYRYRVAAQ